MKKVFLLIGLFGILLFQTEAQTISSISVEEGGVIIIKGYSPATAYLGITLNEGGFPEKNSDAIKVNGQFNIRFYALKEFSGIALQQRWMSDGVEGIVSLWDKKVTKFICGKGNPHKACEYCQRNGFHFENRLDRKTFRYKIFM